MRLVDVDGRAGTVSGMLARMRQSAFQGRKLGEAFEVWQRIIDGRGLIAIGLAGSMSSAGLWPLVAWLVERGYVDIVVSTSANVTEDLLEQRATRFYQVDAEHVDDAELLERRLYRFYDHVVSAADYDAVKVGWKVQVLDRAPVAAATLAMFRSFPPPGITTMRSPARRTRSATRSSPSSQKGARPHL